MYIHTFTHFCESRQRFFSLLSLKYLYISFFRSLPAPCRAPPCSPPPLPRRVAIRVPLSSLPSLPSLPLVLRSCCRVSSGVSPSASPSPWLVPSCLLCVHPVGRAPEAPRRPSVCRAVCPLVAAVTRPPSGAKRCDSVGRCTAYMSPALSPPAYVLPCVPSLVPCVRPCLVLLPAAVCRLVAVIGGMPQYPGRLRCGAASVM